MIQYKNELLFLYFRKKLKDVVYLIKKIIMEIQKHNNKNTKK